jgi:hypothetical protein
MNAPSQEAAPSLLRDTIHETQKEIFIAKMNATNYKADDMPSKFTIFSSERIRAPTSTASPKIC